MRLCQIIKNFFDKKILRLLITSAGLFLFFTLWSIITEPEPSYLAAQLADRSTTKKYLSSIFPERWDYVCPIGETADPKTILEESGFTNMQFSSEGNSERLRLYDGESGIILVDTKASKFALFLLFSKNRMTVIPTIPCIRLKNSWFSIGDISTTEWTYFLLGESS